MAKIRGSLVVMCKTCGIRVLEHQTGASVEELDKNDKGIRLWWADVYRCSRCYSIVLDGFGLIPVAERKKNKTYYLKTVGYFKPLFVIKNIDWRNRTKKNMAVFRGRERETRIG